MVANREGREGMNLEFGVSRSKVLCIEWMDNKVLLCNTRNNIQCPGINHNEKNIKNNICVCVCLAEYFVV